MRAPFSFLVLVVVSKYGKMEDYEHIFDIYSKQCDFKSSNEIIKSVQCLWEFSDCQNDSDEEEKIDIYTLVDYFLLNHRNGHCILDEVPFLRSEWIKL